MSELRKAAEMALEALEYIRYGDQYRKPIDALRAALAQPEQEPVAIHQWRISGLVGQGWYDGYPHDDDRPYEARFLYTAPPQRKPLNGDEMLEVLKTFYFNGEVLFGDIVRAVEKAHGIGGEHG
jgi:hypothetical protein